MRCSFEKLCSYLSHELDDDGRYEVLAHLHECDICMEAIMLMSSEHGKECPLLNSPVRWIGQRKDHSKRAVSTF